MVKRYLVNYLVDNNLVKRHLANYLVEDIMAKRHSVNFIKTKLLKQFGQKTFGQLFGQR
jgi:hypothetical protein